MKLEWKTCVRLGITVFVLYLCIEYWTVAAGLVASVFSAASPLIIGAVIAYLVNILMSFYERHYFPKSGAALAAKTRRPLCMIGAYVTLVAVVVLIISLVVPQLVSCVALLFEKAPATIDFLLDKLAHLKFMPEDIVASLMSIDWESRIEQIISILTSGIGSVMDIVITTVSSVFSGAVTALMAVIFSVYLLLGKDKLAQQTKRVLKHYLKPRWHDGFMYLLTVVHESFRRFIVGQCMEAVIIGILCAIGMWIFNFPYAPMVGALIGFTALIPVAGAYIGAAVGAFMILTVSPIKALLFLVFIVVLQQLEDNLIYPRVVGSSLGLPGIFVLASITIGGGIMGVAGMLLGVPLTSAVYRLVREDMNKTEKIEKDFDKA